MHMNNSDVSANQFLAVEVTLVVTNKGKRGVVVFSRLLFMLDIANKLLGRPEIQHL